MQNLKDPQSVELPRVTKGKRPYFFDDPSVDQLMTFIVELMTEVMVLRDRQDTVERKLDETGVVSRADIEDYRPSPEADAERLAAHTALVQRVLRIHIPGGREE